MTRTLVIQLGRLGDIIQTTPLLSELAATGDTVDALVLHSAHEALLGCPAVANIITLADSLKPLDDAIACGFPHGKIPADAHELLAALHLPTYDRIINASHAPLGCWLANAIPCANPGAIYGGVIRDHECLYFGPASVYRVALLQFREQNLFNLVDLLRGAPAIASRIDAQPRLYANRSATLPFALPHGRKVALNPGASDAARCWPAENFARLAKSLSDAGFVPLLVGAPSERALCEKVASLAQVTVANFAGRTSIPEMATLLATCELLICADTGAAHLAAVGTTVLGLYGRTAWFAETAPYGNNHLILQTPLNAPMSTISPDAVLAAALNRLGRLALSALRRELHTQNQSAWETSIQPPSPTADLLGGLTYRPLHRDSLTPEELFAQSLRQSFATEFSSAVQEDFVALPHADEIAYFAPRAIESAPRFGSAGILAGSEATKKLRTNLECVTKTHALAQVLNHMHTLANLCAESMRTGSATGGVADSSGVVDGSIGAEASAVKEALKRRTPQAASAASALIAAMEKLCSAADEASWRPLAPVIHYVDWQLRMLPPQAPEQTFRAHARAYASAARILRSATRSATNDEAENANDNAATQSGYFDGKGISAKGGKRGDRCLVR